MLSTQAKIGARVRRKGDNGWSTPGAVMRLNDSAAMVCWPDDGFVEIVPLSDLESYDAASELVAA